jgi:hypothetical protein
MSAMPPASSDHAAAAAMARMGLSPATSRGPSPVTSYNNTPVTSRSTSPMPPSSSTRGGGGGPNAMSPTPPASAVSPPRASTTAASAVSPPRAASQQPTNNHAAATTTTTNKAPAAAIPKPVTPATMPVTSTSSAPPTYTKEEMEQRKIREEEEARQKAQLRRDKEEARKLQEQQDQEAAVAGGLGKSGVAFTTSSGDGGENVEVTATTDGTTANDHTMAGAYVFNAYDYLAGTSGGFPSRKFSPIFRVPPFWGLMNLDIYVRRFPLPPEKIHDTAAMYDQMAKALSFLCHVCVETERAAKAGKGRFAAFLRRNGGANEAAAAAAQSPLAFLRINHYACEACIKLISILPHSAGTSGKVLDGLFLNFINVFVSLMENLPANQQIVIPGGWQQPDYTHLVLYIVRNCGDSRFSFTVCNTGRDGLEYHPSSFDPETGRRLKQLAMTIWDIPSSRLLDSTFWTLLFRMQVYPSKRNNAELLYTKLLPALNSRPLWSNLDQGQAEYLEIPDAISSRSFHPLARLALTTTPAAGSRPAKYANLLLMNAAVDLAYMDIADAPPNSMDPEDTRILKLSGRNLSNFASTMDPTTVADGSLGASLSNSWDLLDKLLKKINFSSAKPIDTYTHGLTPAALRDGFAKGCITSMQTSAGSAAHPLFGRLRRDDYENVVKRLMGDPRADPILIPAVLTDEELPPIATNYQDAMSSLQRIADACSLLLQQRRLVKNAPAFAASAAQYALTVILPMPNSEPKFCFWRKAKMRRETQLNLLFLIRRMCRIYSASTACVQQSRGLVAIRSIAFACGACIADAICRVKAVDDPSAFALHYSGLNEGPTDPFGIEAGSFESLGSNMPIYDPNICSLRFQCLDYLRGLSLNMDGTKKDTIFNFDKSLAPMKADMVLINNLSIQLALQRPYPATDEAMANYTAQLISGQNGSIIEVLPEFEYFRDIIFHFKHSVSGKTPTPEVADSHTWLPSDATLHWHVKRKDKENPALIYHVHAFENHHQDFVEAVAIDNTIETKFLGFLALFSTKEKAIRSRLSSADPNTVVNSCGDKFLKKR